MPVMERGWILPEWFNAVEAQGVDAEIICVYTHSVDDTEQILVAHGSTLLYDDRPGRSVNEIDAHVWGAHTTYEYITSLRNGLLEEAMRMGADHFFSLDSDIILSPGALKSLLDYMNDGHPGVVSPSVNMAPGQVCPNTMNWVDKTIPGMANREIPPVTGRVDVIMAAMLLDSWGMECRWQAHGQGEDVGFCLDAEAKQVPRWWVQEIQCEHRMRRY
jgi:hypothetical protein